MTATSAPLEYGYYRGMLSIGSELDEDTRETYTEGDCYLLAWELYQLGLGELIAVMDGSATEPVRDRHWTHMAVRTPEGYILDADGLNEPGLTLGNYCHYSTDHASIEVLSPEAYAVAIGGQAESIHGSAGAREVALELRDWLKFVPPLKPLAS